MKQKLLILLACYITMSATTFIDAILSGSQSGIIDRVLNQPSTMLVAPALIYLVVLFLTAIGFESNDAEVK